MTPLLARMYTEWTLLEARIKAGDKYLRSRRTRVGCLIIALEHRQARRAA